MTSPSRAPHPARVDERWFPLARWLGRALGPGVVHDVGRALALLGGGSAGYAVAELALTLRAYPGPVDVATALRVAAVVAALAALVFFALAALSTAGLIGLHGARALAGRPARALLPGPPPVDRDAPGPARLWAALAVGLLAVGVLQRWAVYVGVNYREQQLAAALIAVVAVALAPVVLGLVRAATRLTAAAAAATAPMLGAASPLGRWLPAYLALWATALGGLAGLAAAMPQIRAIAPWRPLLALMFFGLGAGTAYASAGRWRERRRGLAAAPPRGGARRAGLALVALAPAGLVPLALLHFGADARTRSVVVNGSPTLARLVAVVRRLNDFDGDGFGSLLGENDCRPFDPRINPLARDLPDNGVDENCNGRDFSMRDLARPAGPGLPVPEAFRQPWNILYITIDTVRYDHTTFGGYAAGPKKRDTTPNLARLVDRSTSFTFAQAPSAGTMGSMPALLTSKFFHSGVALEVAGVKPGMPPRLRPENVLISEVMKQAGYATGAITSHEYFADWGMQQGFDSYDNTIGSKPDPFKVTSHLLTDRSLAWISRQQGRKWFLWVHYLDPHGRYVEHPDHVSYGASEEDLYDGELAYTDLHLGRLLTELARLPGGERTVIVITSDHGDAFGEHGFINHGQALYRELLHVPLIVHVPDNPPRLVGGAVSGIDAVPTIAHLAGVDLDRLEIDGKRVTFEGKSLVPQIFYGQEEPERAVFAETNFPQPLRAAVTSAYKVIYNLKNNLTEAYDLKADPWEKSNLGHRLPPGALAVREQLDLWLDRVLFARDPVFNQAAEKMAEVLLPAAVAPPVPAARAPIDGGNLVVVGLGLGVGTGPLVPPGRGENLDVRVYLDVQGRPSGPLRMQLLAWPVAAGADPHAPVPATQQRHVQRTPLRVSADGMFPADRWKRGDHIRERFAITIPADWPTTDVAFGLVVADGAGKVIVAQGAGASADGQSTVVGTIPLRPVTPEPGTPGPVPPGSGAGSAGPGSPTR